MSAKSLPTISVVTPSYNQGQYLEETILSVLDQRYPHTEYIIIDGGSTDNSVEIIRKYEKHLAYWISEPDKGMYYALDKGLKMTRGEIMAWINSDDKYTPWAFNVVGEIFAQLPTVEWLTTQFPLNWDSKGRAIRGDYVPGYSREAFLNGENLPGRPWYASHYIQQESTFWRRGLWDRAGGSIDTSLALAGDFELWARFFQHGDLVAVDTPLAGFRLHTQQKTHSQIQRYGDEAEQRLRQYGGHPHGKFASFMRPRFKRFFPHRYARLGQRLGLVCRSKTCFYDSSKNQWTIKDRIV